ncbi:MAG: hypothetical protein A2Z96_07375 [Spirochaetes bacterium GWB1_48_6]|nr:MAG: hypothetical protein A2Z96_07375 [Spirochaetes bacterium GWB1_48_6]
MIEFLRPELPLPSGLHILSTTRLGGVSQRPWESLNLGTHVGDEFQRVEENRKRLQTEAQLPGDIFWLSQCHGSQVVQAVPTKIPPVADGSWTDKTNQVLGILTADCLPITLWSEVGGKIAALHGGWKGLACGILEKGVKSLQITPEKIHGWIGPGISGPAYEVGDEVRTQFLLTYPQTSQSFTLNVRNKWNFDLSGAAKSILLNLGLKNVTESGLCTHGDSQKFFSYRRDGETGRMATLIWKSD